MSKPTGAGGVGTGASGAGTGRRRDAGRAPEADGADRQHGDAEGEDRRGLGQRQWPGGEQVVDVDREAVGVVGEDHDRAVLPEGPQPHEDHPGPEAVRRGGHVDTEEPGQRTVAEGGGDVAQGRVDGTEGAAGHHDQERRGDERLGDDDPVHRLGEPLPRQLAEERVRADDVDQQDAADERRHGQRELDDHAHRRGQPPSAVGQDVGQRDAGHHPDEH